MVVTDHHIRAESQGDCHVKRVKGSQIRSRQQTSFSVHGAVGLDKVEPVENFGDKRLRNFFAYGGTTQLCLKHQARCYDRIIGDKCVEIAF